MADLTARAQTDSVIAYDSLRLYDGEYVCVMRQDHPWPASRSRWTNTARRATCW